MLVYFDYQDKGKMQRVFGNLNKNTMEITLPSGYVLPVFDNGYVYYMKQTVRVYDVNGNPIGG